MSLEYVCICGGCENCLAAIERHEDQVIRRSSSTPPECQKCGMGMLVATKEQFAARICGSCERASSPPPPSPEWQERYRETAENAAHPEAPPGKSLRCSFCGRSKDNVEHFIAGPSVYICDRCLDEAHDILTEQRKAAKSRPSSPPPPSPTQESGKKIWVHCPNCKTGFINTLFEPATPSSPETPAELTEALDAALKLARDFEWAEHYASLDEGRSIAAKLNSARSALLAIYTRQREEIAEKEARIRELEAICDTNDDIHNDYIRRSETMLRELESASSQLERLKADSLTAEEAKHTYTAHVLASCVICDTIRPKLLRRLSSASGTGGEK